MLRNYLRISFRSLLHNKLFTFINILGLSVGMAAALVIFIWIQTELNFDQHHQDSERIYRIYSEWELGGDRWKIATIPVPLVTTAREEIPEIESITLLGGNEHHVLDVGEGKLLKESAFATVDEKWFEMFEFEVLEGSISSFYRQVYSMAITRDAAMRYFGKLKVVGEIIKVDSIAYTVQAVLENQPANSSFQSQVYVPFESRWRNEEVYAKDQKWDNFNHISFLKVKKGSDPASIPEKLNAIFEREKEQNNASAYILPLANMRFDQHSPYDTFGHQSVNNVYIFGIIGFILLLIAGLNYVNLSTALINKRVKEIGIKKMIGASFHHIFYQLLTETVLMSLIAFSLALALAQPFLPILNHFTGLSLTLGLFQSNVWALFFGIFLLSILISGVYPAILIAGFQPMDLLRNQGKGMPLKAISLRKVLVITQFTIAIIVLGSTIIISQQLAYIQTKQVGYDRSYVANIQSTTFQSDWDEYRKQLSRFESQLREVPEIQAIARTSGSLVNINNTNAGNLSWEGKAEDFDPIVSVLRTDEYLTSVFDLEMAKGRWFSSSFTTDSTNIILNEKAIKAFQLKEPIIGKPISWAGKEGQIIGVVKDFHYQRLDREIGPLLISYSRGFETATLVKVTGETAKKAMNKIEDIYQEVFPNLPFEYNYLDESFQQLHMEEKKSNQLFQIFAAILIFISCLGLFGLSTFAVERRTKEIGIRKVLGANVQIIVQLLSKDFLFLLLISCLIATPITWYLMNRWLEAYAYRVDLAWWMLALAGMSAIIIALITVSFQSVRAALANPVEALRNE